MKTVLSCVLLIHNILLTFIKYTTCVFLKIHTGKSLHSFNTSNMNKNPQGSKLLKIQMNKNVRVASPMLCVGKTIINIHSKTNES